MKRKPPPATIIACGALFFSLVGSGLAASRYLITSTSQIKPTVLRELRGNRGPAGPQGPVGSQGAAGMIAWSSTYIRRSGAVTVGRDGAQFAVAACVRGDHAITGGAIDSPGVAALDSAPGGAPTLDAWIVSAQLVPPATDGTVEAWVECAPA